MSRDILFTANALANEKNVSRDVVFATLEAAILSAARRYFGDKDVDISVKIDRQNGECEVMRRWLVVPDEAGLQEPNRQILLFEARDEVADIEIGQYIEEPIDIKLFGRIGANASKHVIVQGTREAARVQDYNEYLEQPTKIMTGVIKRFEKGNAVIESGRVEGILRTDRGIPKEPLRMGDRVRAYIVKGDPRARGPQFELSRAAPEFLAALFELEVPEIEDGILEIKGVARDPGIRSKIAVYTADESIDPIGTCVGIRGSRVQGVRNELHGENVDIVLWSEDPAQYVIGALAPAAVQSIVVDEDKHTMDVVVNDSERAIAIGRSGQNVDLASRLTGWKINIMTPEESSERKTEERLQLRAVFMAPLDVDEEIADILIDAGFASIEEVAYVPIDEMLEIEALDEETVKELRSRAHDALLTQAIADEEKVEESQAYVASLPELTPENCQQLAQAKINSRDDLADLSVDELQEITQIDSATATAIILKAREHLF